MNTKRVQRKSITLNSPKPAPALPPQTSNLFKALYPTIMPFPIAFSSPHSPPLEATIDWCFYGGPDDFEPVSQIHFRFAPPPLATLLNTAFHGIGIDYAVFNLDRFAFRSC